MKTNNTREERSEECREKMRYRRADAAGGTYFFTANLTEWSSDRLVRHVEELHAVWRLSPGDADYPLRWSLIKAGFSRQLVKDERIRPSRVAKRERGIWQRRYWEHQIRDELIWNGMWITSISRSCASGNRSRCCPTFRHPWRSHAQRNPVKHGDVNRVMDWPYSSFHAHVKRSVYAADWGGGEGVALNGAE